ncbi:biliverdin-producing heme oxygenase [Methylobacterium brachythecii]|uniref:Heme oxygenase n=1 Tax=Methylobacterium brachythecii TaxID=1176177 RepID=A0A7W6F692_9HYPH|nr:biliverdin-producing heme oxygenase [Methylobacterium brachythecii]MBB3902088.1 heme oxygenase [Methylobacterium brachythecii]GLS44485.1 heme oxygenase [Methylobacterium brachythecii]
MSSGLHARLRAATADAHQALEDGLQWEARIATLDGYRMLLALMRGFHAGFEPVIGQALDDEAFFAPRRRLALLDADLDRLGLDAANIAALPVITPITLATKASAYGALYVLEGSTLGGQVIGRTIAARHGPAAEAACSYYRGHGRDTGRMWNAFRAHLEALDDDEVLAAGVATFDALRLWVAEPRPVRAAIPV